MTKVYLRTDGDYSEYLVYGAFSTAEKAQVHVDIYGGKIEEFDLDEEVPDLYKQGLRHWLVNMWRDGTTGAAYEDRLYANDEVPTDGRHEIQHNYQHRLFNRPFGDRSYYFYIWSRTKEDAIKIANERRIQRIIDEDMGVTT
jgi:hypothetical protein